MVSEIYFAWRFLLVRFYFLLLPSIKKKHLSQNNLSFVGYDVSFYLLLLKRNSWNMPTKRFQTLNHSVVSWSLEDKPSPLTDAHFSANLWTSHNTTTHRLSADTFHKLRITYRLFGLYGPVAVWMTGASVKLRVGFVVYSGPQHSMLHFTLCVFQP